MKPVSRSVDRRGRRPLAAATIGPPLFAACGEFSKRSLCDSYEQFLVSREAIRGVDADEDYSTWAPLVADEVETAQEAAAQVAEPIAPQCASTEGN